MKQAQARTAIADAELDEDGNYVKPEKKPAADDGVIIVESDPAPAQVEAKAIGQAPPATESDSGRGLFGADSESVPVRLKKKTSKKKRTTRSRA